jgi:hypothetical protein
LSSVYKIENSSFYLLDKKEELTPLNNDEHLSLRNTNDTLAKLRKYKESKWVR